MSRYNNDFWGPKMQAYFAAKDWVPRVDPHHIYRGHVAVDAIIAEIEPKPYRPKFFEVLRGLGFEVGLLDGRNPKTQSVRVYGSVQP
jgi:hypothetical protein|nr:MAG: hypothetical protein [Bacteriophage sp.]DAJ38731.1 MAG TPA: hypothetical protein [Caudoviricetes sp.]DAN65617.1 MAG TPA: hypothetical protein [Bacteriophage sp.]